MQAALMAQRFQVNGRLVSVEATGSGNVNDTYLVIFRTVFSEERFILQKISKRVFREPEKVMANMHYVTQFVHKRLEAEQDTADRIWQLPRIIPAKDGRDFAVDGEGNYWRAITVIASASSYDQVQSPEHAFEIGAVLGQFHRILSEMPVEVLHDTLPGFHITPRYLRQLDDALAAPEGKARLEAAPRARNAMRFIDQRRGIVDVLEAAKERGELKLRPIHGDPKTANVMIDDATGKGTSIIDLDTVKPGLIHYDIGDCLRSCCNPAGEESAELSSVFFDTDLCKAVLKGYKAHEMGFLTDADRNYLYDAIRLITFELGLRFFADYIAGDIYFRVRREAQNLHRALVQFKLCESIEARESKIRRLAEEV
jgi:Ser/Thr protein kinase RdoA (MazF antagonist)